LAESQAFSNCVRVLITNLHITTIMSIPISPLLAACLLVTATASYNESMPMKRPAVQVSGQHEMCPLAVRSSLKLFQSKSQTFKRHASHHGLFLGQKPWNPTKPLDLHKKYSEIFKTDNRNAASHLWVSYILDRKAQLSHKQIKMLMSSFCAVSGSPVMPGEMSRYRVQLSNVDGGKVYGYTYHCCWPCICDTTDFIKTDTKAIVDQSGETKMYRWLVIGNPCQKSPTPPNCKEEGEKGCLPFEAPELACQGTKLKGAMLSDNGHVIIGPFEEENESFEPEDDYVDLDTAADPEGNTLKGACVERAELGYTSGMGEIFRQVAAINPL